MTPQNDTHEKIDEIYRLCIEIRTHQQMDEINKLHEKIDQLAEEKLLKKQKEKDLKEQRFWMSENAHPLAYQKWCLENGMCANIEMENKLLEIVKGLALDNQENGTM